MQAVPPPTLTASAREDRPRRSVLYLPASRAGAIAKARTLACDAVILDLEDAVAPDAKDGARASAVAAAAAGGWGPRELLLRVNGLDTRWSEADFAAVRDAAGVPRGAGFDGVVVPKVDSAADAARAVAAAGGVAVWAMIETPRAVIEAAAIAATPGVTALVAGMADLAKDLRVRPDAARTPLLYSLSAIIVAARAAGILAFDGVHTAIHDAEGFAAEARQGRMLGFDGKTLVHPLQVDAANAIFSPSNDEIAAARGLLAAWDAAVAAGKGITTFEGKMVEVVHVAEAKRLLALAG